MRSGRSRRVGLGIDALLDFSVAVALDGETLTPAEVRQLLASPSGLVLLRGQWVEIDRERLRAGARPLEAPCERQARERRHHVPRRHAAAGWCAARRRRPRRRRRRGEWSRVEAGAVARSDARSCATPRARAERPPAATCARRCGRTRRSACAGCASSSAAARRLPRRRHGARQDDPGPRPAARCQARAPRGRGRSLLVVPASLIATGRRRSTVRAVLGRCRAPVGCRPSELADAGRAELPTPTWSSRPTACSTALALARERRRGDWSILDEAQAIKNPGTRQTRAVKELKARARIALTGTPVENRLGGSLVAVRLPQPGPARHGASRSPASPSDWPSGRETLRAAARAWCGPISCAG